MLDFDEIVEYLTNMFRQECSFHYIVKSRFLGKNQSMQLFLEELRRKMCKWSYDTVDHFGFDRDVVFLSVNFFERYMATIDLNEDQSHEHESFFFASNREFQLISMTSLYLALKIHGHGSSKTIIDNRTGSVGFLTSDDFSFLSRGLYSRKDFHDMEHKMLEALKWKMNPPTTLNFLQYFSLAIDAALNDNKRNVHKPLQNSSRASISSMEEGAELEKIKYGMYELARYLLELGVTVSDLTVRYRPSIVALASMKMAMNLIIEGGDYMLSKSFRKEYNEVLNSFMQNTNYNEIMSAMSILRRLYHLKGWSQPENMLKSIIEVTPKVRKESMYRMEVAHFHRIVEF